MSDVILIRGDTIAFSDHPGDYGEGHDLYIQHDLTELITDYGLFIPTIEHGTQVMSVMRKNHKGKLTLPTHSRFDLDDITPSPFILAEGTKGVLIAPYEDSVEFFMVRMTLGGKIALAPLKTGKVGHAVIGEHKHLNMLMATAVKLTDNIQDSVRMFCRHTVVTPIEKYLFWTKAQATAFLKEHSDLYKKEEE